MKLKRKLYSKTTDNIKDTWKDIKEVFKDEDIKKSNKRIGMGSVGLTGAGFLFGLHSTGKDSNLAKEDKVITDKLKNLAKNQGIEVKNVEDPSYSSYLRNTGISDRTKKAAKKKAEKLRKKKNLTPYQKYRLSVLEDVINGKEVIRASDKGPVSALAHELGHASHYKNRDGGFIGKAAHKVDGIGRGSVPKLAGLTTGIISGIKAEKAKQRGEKESKLNRLAPIAVPLALSTPLFIAEGAASKKGLKLLKESGASDALIKDAKRRLGAAYSSYLAKAGKNALSGEFGRVIGKGYVKVKSKKDNKI